MRKDNYTAQISRYLKVKGNLQTVDCTGMYAIKTDDDEIPYMQFIKLNGFYHVVSTKFGDYTCKLVRINGEWLDLDTNVI